MGGLDAHSASAAFRVFSLRCPLGHLRTQCAGIDGRTNTLVTLSPTGDGPAIADRPCNKAQHGMDASDELRSPKGLTTR